MSERSHFEQYDCPFPPCIATWWMESGHGFRVPAHAPQGEAAEPWEGTEAENENCPGSFVFVGEVSREVVEPKDQAKLDRAMQQHRLALQIKEQLPEVEQARRNRDGLPKHPFIGFPLGGHPYEPTADAFPGRPADAPEPGPGDAPDKVLPMNQIGQPLGRAAMENAHATTRQLLQLTLSKLVETTNALGKIGAMVDVLDGYVNEVGAHAEAASALCTATVGYGDDAPEAAGRLAGHVQDVKVKASAEHGGDLIAAVTRLNFVVAEILASLAAAADAGEDYHRVLSQ